MVIVFLLVYIERPNLIVYITLINHLRYDTRHATRATRDTRVFLFLCATRESKKL